MDALYLLGHGNDRKLDLGPDVLVVPVVVEDWNRELSPWKAKAVFKGEDFPGEADSFLEVLLTSVLPEAEEGRPIRHRYLVGYSLAGLFALYAATRTTRFDGVGSCSGSLWFDGFVAYLEKNPLQTRKVYLSLGDKEKQAGNERMKEVESCTLKAFGLFQSQDIETAFVLENGGHFQNVEERIKRAVSYLIPTK